MKIIVGVPNHSIKDPFVIAKLLSHLEGKGGSQESAIRRPVEHARRRQRFASQLKEARAPG